MSVQEIARDVQAGRFDALRERARQQRESGQSQSLAADLARSEAIIIVEG